MMPLENEGNSHTATDISKPRLVTIAMTVVLLLETCLILGWVLAKADHGLDLSDESFYLLCIESPGEYPISVSEFGRVLSIPHAALGANLVSFRQLNLVATYGLALVVAYQLLGKWLGNLGCTGFMRLAVSATFALPSLTVMSYWLITPSYNSLNGIAYLLVCVAVFSEPKTDHGRLRAAILIGFGGYLSFMAKPTSAAALGLMVFVLVWVIERWNWKSLVVAIFTALFCLLVTMYLFAGGPVAYVNELRETIAVDMDPTHSFSKLLQWNSPHVDKRWRIVFGASCLILFVLLRFRQRKKMVAFNGWAARIAAWLMIALGGLAIVAMWSDFQGISISFLEHRSDEYGRKERYLFLSTLSVVVLAVFFRQVDRRRFATACFLFWLPYAFAFGTNINYWDKGATVAFYWVISLVVAISAVPLKRHQMSYVLVIASFLPLFCILDLQNAYTQPYRQRAFNENVMKPVIVGSGETELLMVEETADLIDVLRQSASAAGFEPGTPVLDLSGQGIGLIYMIGGKTFRGRGQHKERLGHKSHSGKVWCGAGMTGSTNSGFSKKRTGKTRIPNRFWKQLDCRWQISSRWSGYQQLQRSEISRLACRNQNRQMSGWCFTNAKVMTSHLMRLSNTTQSNLSSTQSNQSDSPATRGRAKSGSRNTVCMTTKLASPESKASPFCRMVLSRSEELCWISGVMKTDRVHNQAPALLKQGLSQDRIDGNCPNFKSSDGRHRTLQVSLNTADAK